MRNRRSTWTSLLLGFLGIAILGLWGSWWIGSLKKGRLKKSPTLWSFRYHFLGLDFLHNYHAVGHWLDGGNPYREPFGDPLGRKLCYPPIVLPAFAWSRALPADTAVVVWTATLAVLSAAGAWACWLVRRTAGLSPLPLPFALAVVLVSSPVAYAMERGNYDLLLVPILLLTAWALRKSSLFRDILTGFCLALAVCFKVYPALLIVALLPLRRGRAALLAVGALGLLMAVQWNDLPFVVANLSELARDHHPERHGVISPSGHSLSGEWRQVWQGTRFSSLGAVPGAVAALAVFGPALVWVGYQAHRCRRPGALVLPYLLWIAAVATFIPSIANDYSLVFLPMAALAVWDRRDPVLVQFGIGGLILWAQPVAFSIDPAVLLGLKVISTLAVGASLGIRLRAAREPEAPVRFLDGGSICPAN